MKKFLTFPSLIFLVLFLHGCQKEEIAKREFPRIEIIDEVIQDNDGISVKANVIALGNSPIIEKGFIWDINKPYTLDNKYTTENISNETGMFSATLKQGFQLGIEYYLKAYVRTNNHLVLSEPTLFKCEYEIPAPIISDFSPKQGTYNDIVEITGINFKDDTDGIFVYFSEKNAIVLNATPTSIQVKVPQFETSGTKLIRIHVLNKTSVSNQLFNYIE